MGFLSKLFGGNKSDKDVKKIQPVVEKINQHFNSIASFTNDQLRNKTQEFRQRIQEHLAPTDEAIIAKNKQAEELPFNDLIGKDNIDQEVDKLQKLREGFLPVSLQFFYRGLFSACPLPGKYCLYQSDH